MKNLKSKIIAFALAICLIVPCMLMLTACKEEHTHTLTKVDAVQETCTTDGNTEYYKCDCGKYFSDNEAKTEIQKDSWVVDATGHSFASTWTYNETHHWKEATCSHTTEKSEYAEHSLTNNVCACGYVAVTYTVADADAWAEVFTGDYLMNVSVNMVENYYQNDVLVPEESGVSVLKSTDESRAMILEEESQYLVKQDGVWYGLEQESGAWYGVQLPDAIADLYTFANMYGNIFVEQFESFTYDEENKCYYSEEFVVNEEYNIVADYTKVFIENGKLVRIEMKNTVEDNVYGMADYTFSDYGTTEIDVPDWTVYEG